MYPRSHPRPLAAVAAAIVATLLVAGCSNSHKSSTQTVKSQSQDNSLHNQLPAKIKSAGVVKVATDASYAPNEFFDTDNKTIIGMDVDLGHALGQVLGVRFDFTNTSFDGIIPALGSRYDLGMSSFTDNKEREKVVDMVTYYSAGTSFVVKKGSNVTINTLADLCGHKVAVEKGTTQLDDATAQGKKCGSKKVTVLAFPDQNGANLALNSGRADVVMADSPVNAYAVKQSNGAFQTVGQVYGTAPYGIAVPKAADYKGLADALLAAMKKLIANGTYKTVLSKWGIQDGGITNPVINGATS